MSWLIFLTIIGFTLANPGVIPSGKVSNRMAKTIANNYKQLLTNKKINSINDLVDIVMTEMQRIWLKQGLDSINVQDIHQGISYKPSLITFYGELHLTNGFVKGISTIARNGDVALNYKNRILSMDIPLHFDNIVLSYDYKVAIRRFTPRGGVKGTAKDIKLRIVLEFDFATMQMKLKLFKVLKVGNIMAKFSGNNLFNWLLNLLNKTAIFIFKNVIISMTEMIVRDSIKEEINEINKMLPHLIPARG